MSVKQIHKECPVCNSAKTKKKDRYYNRKGLVKCTSCGLYFMERIPTQEELTLHYSDYPYVFPPEVRISVEKNYDEVLKLIEPFRKNNLLLDYGCGTGLFLLRAKMKGWEIAGIELSEKALKECRSEGIPTYSSFEELSKKEKRDFDVVISIEVIEHLSNFPVAVKQIYSHLRTGGAFYCTTPNFNNLTRYIHKENYHIIEYPEHLLYFSIRSLDKGLKRCGFKSRMTKTTGIDISSKRKNFELASTKPVSLTSNEKYLARSNKSYILGILKKTINLFLSLLRIGMTIKVLYTKEN